MIVPVISYLLMACSGFPAPTTDTINEGKPLVYASLKSSEKELYLKAIKPIYEKQLLKTGFNGAILYFGKKLISNVILLRMIGK